MNPAQNLSPQKKFRSIFSPGTKKERIENFEDYWVFSKKHSGEILEASQDLTKKRELLQKYQNNPVRSRKPLVDEASFYRNYVTLKDNPQALDRKTLLLCCIYKFARHEWVGISGAWEAIPNMAKAKKTTEKISRYHLCEEFCHVRLFHEMFKTMQLSDVQWVPLGKWMQKVYRIFPYLPEALMAGPAFVTELMGITFYSHVDNLLDEIFADEPEAKERIRALLYEIMVDELAHIGQRRNFIGPLGMRTSRLMVGPIYRAFFHDIPESKYLFDIKKMIKDGRDFNYSQVSEALLKLSWVPSYCQV